MPGLPVGRTLAGITSALIIIVLILIFGPSIYSYVSGLFSSSTTNISVSVKAQIIVNPSSNQAFMQYSLTNNGNIAVSITAIEVNGYIMNVSFVLFPGGNYQGVLPLPFSVEPGKYYTVIFHGQVNGKPFTVVTNVLSG